MANKRGIGPADFGRTIDEFFDEMLVERWGCGRGDAFERSELLDLPDRYEIRISAEGIEERKIDVELHGQRLTVRAPAGVRGRLEASFSFREGVDASGATARWAGGVLTIVLPKDKPRRIALKDN